MKKDPCENGPVYTYSDYLCERFQYRYHARAQGINAVLPVCTRPLPALSQPQASASPVEYLDLKADAAGTKQSGYQMVHVSLHRIMTERMRP